MERNRVGPRPPHSCKKAPAHVRAPHGPVLRVLLVLRVGDEDPVPRAAAPQAAPGDEACGDAGPLRPCGNHIAKHTASRTGPLRARTCENQTREDRTYEDQTREDQASWELGSWILAGANVLAQRGVCLRG